LPVAPAIAILKPIISFLVITSPNPRLFGSMRFVPRLCYRGESGQKRVSGCFGGLGRFGGHCCEDARRRCVKNRGFHGRFVWCERHRGSLTLKYCRFYDCNKGKSQSNASKTIGNEHQEYVQYLLIGARPPWMLR